MPDDIRRIEHPLGAEEGRGESETGSSAHSGTGVGRICGLRKERTRLSGAETAFRRELSRGLGGVETGRWAIDYEFLMGRWSEKAFKPSGGDWYIGSDEQVDDTLCRHVLCRWGLSAALKFRTWLVEQLDVGTVGDDRKLEQDVLSAGASALSAQAMMELLAED